MPCYQPLLVYTAHWRTYIAHNKRHISLWMAAAMIVIIIIRTNVLIFNTCKFLLWIDDESKSAKMTIGMIWYIATNS